MEISTSLKVNLKDAKYNLMYRTKGGRNTEKVTVVNGEIDKESLLNAASIYRERSMRNDHIFIEEIVVHSNGVIEYYTGS
jgi:hypothetical protein